MKIFIILFLLFSLSLNSQTLNRKVKIDLNKNEEVRNIYTGRNEFFVKIVKPKDDEIYSSDLYFIFSEKSGKSVPMNKLSEVLFDKDGNNYVYAYNYTDWTNKLGESKMAIKSTIRDYTFSWSRANNNLLSINHQGTAFGITIDYSEKPTIYITPQGAIVNDTMVCCFPYIANLVYSNDGKNIALSATGKDNKPWIFVKSETPEIINSLKSNNFDVVYSSSEIFSDRKAIEGWNGLLFLEHAVDKIKLLRFSPDNKSLRYIIEVNNNTYFFDGKYRNFIKNYSEGYSIDGSNNYLLIPFPDGEYLYVNDKLIRTFDIKTERFHNFVFTPDNDYLYQYKKDSAYYFWYKNKQYGPYISGCNPIFSLNGQKYAYIINEPNNESFIVYGNNKYGPFSYIHKAMFLNNGNSLYYITEDNSGNKTVYNEDKKIKSFKNGSVLEISDDGSEILMQETESDKYFISTSKFRYGPFEKIFSADISADGKNVAFCTKNINYSYELHYNNKVVDVFDWDIEPISFIGNSAVVVFQLSDKTTTKYIIFDEKAYIGNVFKENGKPKSFIIYNKKNLEIYNL